MPNIEKIASKLTSKLANLPVNIRVVTPDHQLSPSLQADWLISLLVQLYTQHALTNNRNQLIQSIESESCQCWFALQDTVPIASSALITQSDGSVELGRAVSLRPGTGSLLMLQAALHHFTSTKSPPPLVTETRVADQFEYIASGQATQIICFNHLDLTPHALVAPFNHGQPLRQEPFILATSQSPSASEPLILPPNSNSEELVAKTALPIAQAGILPKLSIQTAASTSPIGWEIVMSTPFTIIVPSSSPTSIETTLQATNEFTLIPITASPTHIGALPMLLDLGFVPCGIDRNLGSSGHPILLLGRLNHHLCTSPMRLVSSSLSQPLIDAFHTINRLLRRRHS